MSVTRLSDAFIHDVYASYSALNGPETSAFYAAGIISSSPTLDAIAQGGGKNAVVPFWNDLDPTVEPNYSNDDPTDLATPDAVTSGTMTGRKAWVNKGYGDMDLVQELAGSSPMQQIRNRFGVYWTRQLERRVINAAIGIQLANVANDGGDMTIDISGLSGADAVFGSDAFIDAAYTAGDRAEMFTGIAVHSAIMARMVKNDEIVMIPDSNGGLTIPTYKGRVVITDDLMPVTGGVYTSILFGRGAFGFGSFDGAGFAIGEGIPRVAFELWRQPQAGNGGGLEQIWERKTWLLHPFGFNWIDAGGGALTEFSPTLANLRTAAKWQRVVFRKAVPMAFIKSRAVAA